MPRLLVLSNARSGSTLFTELINSHPEINVGVELLNDENDFEGDPLEYTEKQLSSQSETIIGFKLFPEQLFECKLDLTTLVRKLGITFIIVLWREDLVETLVSRRIAEETGEWYRTSAKNSISKIVLCPEDLKEYIDTTIGDWCKIAEQWPDGINPIYVKYEDLILNPMEQIQTIFSRLSYPTESCVLRTQSIRQNPAKLSEKVINFPDIPNELLGVKLNVSEIIQQKIQDTTIIERLATETLPFAPDKEPCIPPGGWRYRVAEPFITGDIKQNVFDAIESGSISSAGFWPRMMTSKLKALFQLPVAQPCCNGFTALMLAFQAANIQVGDEIIMPSMTMIAVPNAAYFMRATPVFADCAHDGNYTILDGKKFSLSLGVKQKP